MKKYKHKETKPILLQLLDKADEDTREYATHSLLEIYGETIVPFLEAREDDIVTAEIKDWSE